jgi:hypothetical protein
VKDDEEGRVEGRNVKKEGRKKECEEGRKEEGRNVKKEGRKSTRGNDIRQQAGARVPHPEVLLGGGTLKSGLPPKDHLPHLRGRRGLEQERAALLQPGHSSATYVF